MASRTYTDEDLDRIFRREPLITEGELLRMWPITKRKLRELVNGQGPVRLPAVRFSQKQIAFRAADVLRVEEKLFN